MDHIKCSFCHRRNDCALRDLAVLTLPWVAEAIQQEEDDWSQIHAVQRALRGSGYSPGFVEDWKFAGAMTQQDVNSLVETIVNLGEVNLGLLCRACRHYLGPELHPTTEELSQSALC